MEGIAELNLITTGLKTMGMLSIVLGLLVLILYLMKRFFVHRKGTKGELLIRTLSSSYLSPKERIEVIEVSGEQIVLGITPGRISFLTKISPAGGLAEVQERNRDDQACDKA